MQKSRSNIGMSANLGKENGVFEESGSSPDPGSLSTLGRPDYFFRSHE